MKIMIDNKEQEIFFNKFQKLPKKVKFKPWGSKKLRKSKRIECVIFACKEISEAKLLNYFNVLENRYRFAIYCLEAIRKECENITDNETRMKELVNKAKSNSVNTEFVIKTEYLIYAVNSCFDTIAHIINIIYNLGISETSISFESVYKNIKYKRDKFTKYFLKERKGWIKTFRDIRNRMTHHQIISFSSQLSHETEAKQVKYTKHCISVIDKNDDEELKPLPNYFEEIINNYNKSRSRFYEKLNSVI